jgi:hypothetical protein
MRCSVPLVYLAMGIHRAFQEGAEWTVTGAEGPVQTDRPYALWNAVRSAFLATSAGSLAWSGDLAAMISFSRDDGDGTVTEGEALALRVGHAGYLGWDLSWSQRPAFEWRLMTGKSQVLAGMRLALFNRREGAYLVCVGDALRWKSSALHELARQGRRG